MRKIFSILFLVFMSFLLQFFIFNILGKQWTPHLLLLLLVFITLVLGIRYGLLTGFLSGFLLDSYSVDVSGLHTFSMIACAYLIIFFHKYIFRSGSRPAIACLTFLVLFFDVIIKSSFHVLSGTFHWQDIFRYVLIPQVGLTLLLSTFIFRGLRQCASKLFV